MAISPDTLLRVTTALNAATIEHTELIQPLWSGYGELFRATLSGSEQLSVIVKHIKLPQPSSHPRGWSGQISHLRKLRSYEVEVNWYRHYANMLYQSGSNADRACPMPKCLHVEQSSHDILLVLEDLATLGFDRVVEQSSFAEIRLGLKWLAHFHAHHMFKAPKGLWDCGTYWHLDTRPEELSAMPEGELKAAAAKLDARLKQCRFQTLVHGDAKLANFVFSNDAKRVAAVDFQYVGQGCGMKDVIMLLSSAVPTEQCGSLCPALLDHYFRYLKQSIAERNALSSESAIVFEELENAWRQLYCIAWADFQRFLIGWSPGHWKINDYSEALTRQALEQLQEP
jgi:hypothetical protein